MILRDKSSDVGDDLRWQPVYWGQDIVRSCFEALDLGVRRWNSQHPARRCVRTSGSSSPRPDIPFNTESGSGMLREASKDMMVGRAHHASIKSQIDQHCR